MDILRDETLKIIDYKRIGLFFDYYLLGYGVMALATFFIGLTINAEFRPDKWLEGLLIIHGIFFISCFFLPMLGVFNSETDGVDWIGTLILEVWCLYFLPICICHIFISPKKSSKCETCLLNMPEGER